MLFSSFSFIFNFLPAVVIGFAAARLHSPRAGILVLLAASIVFYGAWKPVYLLLFLGSIVINFSLGLAMEKEHRRRAIGIFGIALNLFALGVFKYANFFLDNVNALTGAHLPAASIILPLGISFFTFQQIAYLVDVMRGARIERDVVSYALFVSFFPHLIAGPLVHHAEMIPQFKRPRTSRSAVMAARGVAIFAAGLFKKVIIADTLAQFVTPAFAHVDGGGTISASWAWLATLAYTLQLYFDFSGYSDMAIGLALMFGIRLPVNFRSPYQAASIIEFWRCWHVTLSRFLRDYLYIPLGGNRRGASRRYVNVMLTMLLGGLWHGAGWNFVVWGGLHGAYLCINQAWRARFHIGRAPSRVSLFASWFATFAAVVFAWVFFRATTMNGALAMLEGMAGGSGTYMSDGIVFLIGLPLAIGADAALFFGAAATAAGLAIAFVLPNVPQIFRYREYRRAPDTTPWLRWQPNLAWALVTGVTLTLALFGMWQRMEFLYFQF